MRRMALAPLGVAKGICSIFVARCLAWRKLRDSWRLKTVVVDFGGGGGGISRST